MSTPLLVVGHKNPDTDSICAAIAAADLWQQRGETGAFPGRQGEPNAQTRYVLERFSVPLPPLVSDVRRRVRDVMTMPALTVRPDQPLVDAGRLIQSHDIRALPVVDAAGRPVGIVSVDNFARLFFEGLDPDLQDTIPLDLENIVRALGGRVLVAAPERVLRDKVMVAAMRVESMQKRVEPDCLIVLGDREDAQRAAIEAGAGALIVTGNLPVSEAIIALAQEHQVTVISSPHHTYTTVRLLNASIPVSHIMHTDVQTVHEDDLLEEIRPVLTQQRLLPVLDDAGRVIGVVSRTSLIKDVRHRVLLVDHNERAQTIEGLEEAELVGIIDHHRLADIQTGQPILFRCEPVGCTCTILWEMYGEAGLLPSPALAGLMLAAILADTVVFRSPTCTERDRRAARALAGLARLDPVTLGHEIMLASSDLSGRSAREILSSDFKEFTLADQRFGVGTLETMQRATVEARRPELLAELSAWREQGRYEALLFAIMDVTAGETELLLAGDPARLAAAFGRPLNPDGHSLTFPSILSRKKEIIPVLARLAHNTL